MCSLSAPSAQGKPNQLNTPIDKKISQPETVTITDPRHPLYDQTFPLLHIQNKHDLVLSCQVQIIPGANRLVPVGLTDLASAPSDVFPVPLDISSLRKLVQTYQRIAAQVETEKRDEGTAQSLERGSRRNSVANTRRQAAARGAEGDGVHLPVDSESASRETES
jgi:hypothetical protein